MVKDAVSLAVDGAALAGRLSRMRTRLLVALSLLLVLWLAGCASTRPQQAEVTAYCPCGKCCGWTRSGFRRVIADGPSKGRPYSGLTASGKKPRQYQPGLFSADSLCHPWMIPFRIIFPWKIPRRAGTVAADTDYYPFGTRIEIPGYGLGVVEDRGKAMKGPHRFDVFYRSHDDALEWGRRQGTVYIRQP